MDQQYPSEIMDRSPEADSWEQLPKEWQEKVRAKIEDQLKRSIAYTVPALGLGR